MCVLPSRRRPVTSAAIYARVSSARQKKDETICSQTASLRVHAGRPGFRSREWSSKTGPFRATLVRPP